MLIHMALILLVQITALLSLNNSKVLCTFLRDGLREAPPISSLVIGLASANFLIGDENL